MKTNPEPPKEEPRGITSLKVLGARLTWAALGPLAFLITIWALVSHRKTWLSWLDAVFAGIVGLMLLGRWVEQRSGTATTLTGEPATLAQCRRYTITLPAVAAIAWLAAKTLRIYVLA